MQTGAVVYDDSGRPVLVDGHRSVDERVRAIRRAWERLRGQTAPAWRADSVRAAEEALRSAGLATAVGLGELVREDRRASWQLITRHLRRLRRPAVRVGDVAAATAEVERRLAEVEGILGPDHAVMGVLHFLLGRLLLTGGDAGRARDELTMAVGILETEMGVLSPFVNAARRMLGSALAGLGDLDSAHREYEAVLDRIADRVATAASDPSRRVFRERALEQLFGIREMDFTPDSPAEAVARTELAITCQGRGDLAGARTAFERALPVLDGSEATMTLEQRASLGLAHTRYGGVLSALGDKEPARAEHERALKILRDVLGDRHVLVASTQSNLGLVLKALGQHDAARAQYEQAVAVLDAILESGTENNEAVDLAVPYANLGTLLYELGECDAARTRLERAIAITEAAVGPDDGRMGTLRCTYGAILAALGDHDTARAELERALEIAERTLGADAPLTQVCRDNLAAVSS